MPYQTYQAEEIVNLLNDPHSIEYKVFSTLLNLGISELSAQKILGSDEVRKKSFWNKDLKEIPTIVRHPYETRNDLWIAKESAELQGFVLNDIGIGIAKSIQRAKIRNQIILSEVFAELFYDARMYGKIVEVNMDNPSNPAFTYATPAKDGTDNVKNHSIQFIDAESLLEDIDLLSTIHKDIKTIVVTRADQFINDPFQAPLLFNFAQKLIESDYLFAFSMDVEGDFLYLLSKHGISRADALTFTSPSYSNRFIPSNIPIKYHSSIDLLDPDGYRSTRLEQYGINIELGIVQMEDEKMTRFIMDNIAKNVIERGMYVSKALKSAFQSYDDTLFDIDDLIKNNTYEELNEIARNMKFPNYVWMLSTMVKNRKGKE